MNWELLYKLEQEEHIRTTTKLAETLKELKLLKLKDKSKKDKFKPLKKIEIYV